MSELKDELRAVLQCESPGYPFPERSETPQSAAVLALFHGTSLLESEVLLTKRSLRVATHAGQVAFPGGGIEPVDEGDFLRTALREAWEEVGVHQEGVRLLGALPSLPTVTGSFSVVPVLGIMDSGFRQKPFVLDAHEVDHADWVRVESLLGSRFEEIREVRGLQLSLPEFRWGQERMWGMTALIFDLILKRYDRIRAC
jgi:8-oxo-dGTP pyrophosphatase MutT (NUDIX family)